MGATLGDMWHKVGGCWTEGVAVLVPRSALLRSLHSVGGMLPLSWQQSGNA
jgi:hypothetical protein